MRPALLLTAVLTPALLAGCNAAAPDAVPVRPRMTVAERTMAPPLPSIEGRWAVRDEMCGDGWWIFEGERVRTAGETFCRVSSREALPEGGNGVLLHLQCSAEGNENQQNWAVAKPDSRTLVVDRRDGFAPVTLRACPASPLA